jgi:hypothetical protein
MEEFSQLGRLIQQNESILLWVAILIGVLFLGLVAFDAIQRWRSDNRYSDEPVTLRRAFMRPFRRAAELRAALKTLRRQRAERKRWDVSPKRRRRFK